MPKNITAVGVALALIECAELDFDGSRPFTLAGTHMRTHMSVWVQPLSYVISYDPRDALPVPGRNSVSGVERRLVTTLLLPSMAKPSLDRQDLQEF